MQEHPFCAKTSLKSEWFYLIEPIKRKVPKLESFIKNKKCVTFLEFLLKKSKNESIPFF
jgi:hypothetical protein